MSKGKIEGKEVSVRLAGLQAQLFRGGSALQRHKTGMTDEEGFIVTTNLRKTKVLKRKVASLKKQISRLGAQPISVSPSISRNIQALPDVLEGSKAIKKTLDLSAPAFLKMFSLITVPETADNTCDIITFSLDKHFDKPGVTYSPSRDMFCFQFSRWTMSETTRWEVMPYTYKTPCRGFFTKWDIKTVYTWVMSWAGNIVPYIKDKIFFDFENEMIHYSMKSKYNNFDNACAYSLISMAYGEKIANEMWDNVKGPISKGYLEHLARHINQVYKDRLKVSIHDNKGTTGMHVYLSVRFGKIINPLNLDRFMKNWMKVVTAYPLALGTQYVGSTATFRPLPKVDIGPIPEDWEPYYTSRICEHANAQAREIIEKNDVTGSRIVTSCIISSWFIDWEYMQYFSKLKGSIQPRIMQLQAMAKKSQSVKGAWIRPNVEKEAKKSGSKLGNDLLSVLTDRSTPYNKWLDAIHKAALAAVFPSIDLIRKIPWWRQSLLWDLMSKNVSFVKVTKASIKESDTGKSDSFDPTQIISIDCEYISDSGQKILKSVGVVDFFGNIIADLHVSDYEEKMKMTMVRKKEYQRTFYSTEDVVTIVNLLLKDKFVIVYGSQDFHFFNRPAEGYYLNLNGLVWMPKKALSENYKLFVDSDTSGIRAHNAVDDAFMTMELYKAYKTDIKRFKDYILSCACEEEEKLSKMIPTDNGTTDDSFETESASSLEIDVDYQTDAALNVLYQRYLDTPPTLRYGVVREDRANPAYVEGYDHPYIDIIEGSIKQYDLAFRSSTWKHLQDRIDVKLTSLDGVYSWASTGTTWALFAFAMLLMGGDRTRNRFILKVVLDSLLPYWLNRSYTAEQIRRIYGAAGFSVYSFASLYEAKLEGQDLPSRYYVSDCGHAYVSNNSTDTLPVKVLKSKIQKVISMIEKIIPPEDKKIAFSEARALTVLMSGIHWPHITLLAMGKIMNDVDFKISEYSDVKVYLSMLQHVGDQDDVWTNLFDYGDKKKGKLTKSEYSKQSSALKYPIKSLISYFKRPEIEEADFVSDMVVNGLVRQYVSPVNYCQLIKERRLVSAPVTNNLCVFYSLLNISISYDAVEPEELEGWRSKFLEQFPNGYPMSLLLKISKKFNFIVWSKDTLISLMDSDRYEKKFPDRPIIVLTEDGLLGHALYISTSDHFKPCWKQVLELAMAYDPNFVQQEDIFMLPNNKATKTKKLFNKSLKKQSSDLDSHEALWWHLRKGLIPKDCTDIEDKSEVDNALYFIAVRNFNRTLRFTGTFKCIQAFRILTVLMKSKYPKYWTPTEKKEVEIYQYNLVYIGGRTWHVARVRKAFIPEPVESYPAYQKMLIEISDKALIDLESNDVLSDSTLKEVSTKLLPRLGIYDSLPMIKYRPALTSQTVLNEKLNFWVVGNLNHYSLMLYLPREQYWFYATNLVYSKVWFSKMTLKSWDKPNLLNIYLPEGIHINEETMFNLATSFPDHKIQYITVKNLKFDSTGAISSLLLAVTLVGCEDLGLDGDLSSPLVKYLSTEYFRDFLFDCFDYMLFNATKESKTGVEPSPDFKYYNQIQAYVAAVVAETDTMYILPDIENVSAFCDDTTAVNMRKLTGDDKEVSIYMTLNILEKMVSEEKLSYMEVVFALNRISKNVFWHCRFFSLEIPKTYQISRKLHQQSEDLYNRFVEYNKDLVGEGSRLCLVNDLLNDSMYILLSQSTDAVSHISDANDFQNRELEVHSVFFVHVVSPALEQRVVKSLEIMLPGDTVRSYQLKWTRSFEPTAVLLAFMYLYSDKDIWAPQDWYKPRTATMPFQDFDNSLWALLIEDLSEHFPLWADKIPRSSLWINHLGYLVDEITESIRKKEQFNSGLEKNLIKGSKWNSKDRLDKFIDLYVRVSSSKDHLYRFFEPQDDLPSFGDFDPKQVQSLIKDKMRFDHYKKLGHLASNAVYYALKDIICSVFSSWFSKARNDPLQLVLQEKKDSQFYKYIPDLGLNARLVSTNALSLATPTEILSWYENPNTAVQQEKVYVPAIEYGVNADGIFFTATPCGMMPYRLQTYLTTHFNLCEKSFNRTTSHTVHNIIRFTINALMWENLERLSGEILTMREHEWVIIDLGSKYAKFYKYFRQILQYKQMFDPNFVMHLVCVRPNDSDYDKVYHSDHYDEVSSLVIPGMHISIYKNYIQNVDDEISIEYTGLKSFYFMNDVHYYLADWKPKWKGKVYCSGGLFPSVWGRSYRLPFAQGIFDIIPYADRSMEAAEVPTMVRMTPKGTMNYYEHPNTSYGPIDKMIDFGWYKQFNSVSTTDEVIIKKNYVPSQLTVLGCSQRDFYNNVTAGINVQALKSKHIFSSASPLDVRWDMDVTYLVYIFSVLMILYDMFIYFLRHFDIKWQSASISDYVDYFCIFLVVAAYVVRFADRYRTVMKKSDMKPVKIINAGRGKVITLLKMKIVNIFLSALFRIAFPWYAVTFIVQLIIYVAFQEPSSKKLSTMYLKWSGDDVRCVSDIAKHRIVEDMDRCDRGEVMLGGRLTEMEHDITEKGLCRMSLYTSGEYQEMVSEYLKQKNPRLRKLMFSEDASFQIESGSYYMEKPVPSSDITFDHHTVITIPIYHERVCEVIKQRLTHCTQQDDRTLMVTRTGFDTKFMGEPATEFEWSSKSEINAYSALFSRHLSPKVQPDPQCVADLGDMVKDLLKLFQPVLGHFRTFTEWIDQKTDFQAGKRLKYYKTYLDQKYGSQKKFIGDFKTMVKSGEVYYTSSTLEKDRNGWCIKQESRPRNICVPDDVSWGFITYLQSFFWAPIKDFLPGFIQGMNKKDMLKLFRSKVKPSWNVISLDGSAYDSTQFASIMEVTDNILIEHLKPIVLEVAKLNGFAEPSVAANRMVHDMWDTRSNLFTRIPGAEFPVMPGVMIRKLRTSQKFIKNEKEWFATPMHGTTFSGHPTRTTLGNTFRSLCYVYYYLEKAGIMRPWDNDEIFVAASGDDVCIFHDPKYTRDIQWVISNLTFKDKSENRAFSLGQVVKSTTALPYYMCDFCSKWSFCSDPQDVNTWTMCRDYKKVLNTKIFYKGQNKIIHQIPAIHAKAIYDGVCSEKVSHLLEDVLALRVEMSVRGAPIDMSHPLVKQAYDSIFTQFKQDFYAESDNDYEYEAQINQSLGLTYSSLLEIWINGDLNLIYK